MPDLRICCLGDSFVNGTGDPTHLGWAGRLCVSLSQHGLPITYYNLGIRGETSQGLAQRWRQEVERRSTSTAEMRLLFSFGTNDTTIQDGQLRVDLKNSLHNAHQILRSAQQSYLVLMISPPPIADSSQCDRTRHLVSGFDQICQELQIPYLDVFTPLLESKTWMGEVAQGDGAHPQAAGYEILTQQVKSWSAWQEWFRMNSPRD